MRIIVPLVAALALLGLPAAPPAAAQTPPTGRSVDLKVLVVSVGDRASDPGLDLMARTMDQVGVPYDVLDASTTPLTDAYLRTGDRGHYNGIVLTQADLYTPNGSGFTLEEWQRLHTYERDFRVRESVVAGFPATDPGHDLDYGMAGAGAQAAGVGRWVSPAGTGRLFAYVNTANTLTIPEFGFWGAPQVGQPGRPTVTPLLVDDGVPDHVYVSKLDYADGREVLLSTVGNAWFRLHSNVLAYQFLDFATSGVFLGGRFVSLSTHTDDMFLADDLWDPVANQTNPATSYRITPADLDNVVAQQAAFRAEHPLAAGWQVELPYNGIGAKGWTPNPRVVRNAADDAMLVSGSLWSYGRATSLTVSRSGNSERRAIVRAADVSAPPAPPADRVDRVLLRLVVSNALAQPLAVQVCPLTQTWTEGNGNGGLLDLGPPTWSSRASFTSWATSGGSVDASACLTRQLTGPGVNELDITPIWQAWASGARPNHGVLIRATANGTATFASAENGTAANRPTLQFETSSKPEPLTAKVLEVKDQFGWINHTYAALQMDRLCPDPDEPQPAECPVTDYATAHDDIARNRVTWTELGLPGYQEGLPYLLSDSHAGLHDRRGTEEDPSDDVPFPQGANPNFMQAAQDLGVRYIAADSSRPNQDREQRVPGFDLVVLPRYPTNVYVNATTPAEDLDEYNWLYYERHVAAGNDPCTIPGAICSPKTYDQLLAAEADTTVSHMLSGKEWPHYFHQSNLRNYGGGRTLQTDWMDAVMTRYEQLFTLPVRTPQAHELGPAALDRIVAREQAVRGWLDIDTQIVTLVANGTARPLVTGVTGGTPYGGQSIAKVTVDPTPRTFAVDPSSAG
ncbi:MAG TPA: DNRLRE domain-containing protein [Acidimicrobiales bacterium]|nr:DNRLRE domain-containing protein [Acidimicrobiales bacterium]